MYKFNTKADVHNHAKVAEGKTMYELNGNKNLKSTKSSVGDAFEKWFGKEKDNQSKPDIEEVGIELKATPYKKLKNGNYSAKERLVFNIINYHSLAEETFEDSHFLYKNSLIEIAFYEYLKDIPQDLWTISHVILYEMNKNPIDYQIIKDDWEKIQSYVKNGDAHLLSESLTNYLSACTKGANSKSLRSQPFSSEMAMQRAYSFKSSYMTSILRKYIFGEEKTDSIIKDRIELAKKDIETIILERFEPYIGLSIEELKERFNIRTSYHTNYLVAAAILNLKGSYTNSEAFKNVEEFEKASIVLKTVQFNEKNINKESMSFPSFRFSEIVEENWIDENGSPNSEWHSFLLDSRFLFFVVKRDSFGKNIFKGVKFFSIPQADLQGPIRFVWEDTVEKLKKGVILEAVPRGTSIQIRNNFIKKTDNQICHVRPHESLADYSENGKYADKLPAKVNWINKPQNSKYSNQWMTKQSFWLNNDYIREQVKDLLI